MEGGLVEINLFLPLCSQDDRICATDVPEPRRCLPAVFRSYCAANESIRF